MKIAFFGDVVGKPGRQAVLDHLPGLKARLQVSSWCPPLLTLLWNCWSRTLGNYSALLPLTFLL